MEDNIIDLQRKVKVLNNENNKMYKEIKRLEVENRELSEGYNEEFKENVRLNNIINELEKESYLGMIENQNNNDYSRGLYTAYKYINDKLQELKGVDKE